MTKKQAFKNVIPRLGGCVEITLKCKFVILNEVKNLIRSMCYKTEIFRLGPQNDIATQPLDQGIHGVLNLNKKDTKIIYKGHPWHITFKDLNPPPCSSSALDWRGLG
jgi:hypothetical protein